MRAGVVGLLLAGAGCSLVDRPLPATSLADVRDSARGRRAPPSPAQAVVRKVSTPEREQEISAAASPDSGFLDGVALSPPSIARPVATEGMASAGAGGPNEQPGAPEEAHGARDEPGKPPQHETAASDAIAGFRDGVRLSQASDEMVAPVRVPRMPAAGEEGEQGQEDTNLDRPRAERRGGGGGPTRASEEEEEETEEDVFKSDLLVKLLGLEDSDVGIFGWLQGSFTGNPAAPRDGENFGVNPNFKANTWQFQQFYLVVERLVEQSDEVNFGFRLDNLFGTDYSMFHDVGLFDRAFPPNGFGYDPVQFYGQAHLPVLTDDGVDVIVGRFYSLAGYEDGRAPARPLNSTSYLFGYAHPFTHVGMMSTWHVSDQINVYNGAINGWDRWINRHNRWGYTGGFSWDSKDGRTDLTFILTAAPQQFARFLPAGYPLPPNGIAPPPFLAQRRNIGYPGDNSVLFSTVLIHKWTDDLTMIVEMDDGFESNVPGIGPAGTTQNASWYGAGGWLLYEFTDRLTGVYRGEVFRDQNGARTGVNDTFYEMTLGAIYKPVTWFWLRPEIRFDWAAGVPAYDDQTSKHQLTLGFDAIFLF
jgi:hypothetical protein